MGPARTGVDGAPLNGQKFCAELQAILAKPAVVELTRVTSGAKKNAAIMIDPGHTEAERPVRQALGSPEARKSSKVPF